MDPQLTKPDPEDPHPAPLQRLDYLTPIQSPRTRRPPVIRASIAAVFTFLFVLLLIGSLLIRWAGPSFQDSRIFTVLTILPAVNIAGITFRTIAFNSRRRK